MIDGFILKVKRAETPFYRALRDTYKSAGAASLPVPRFLYPVLRLLFEARRGVIGAWYGCKRYFYCGPLFTSRCEKVGKHLRIYAIPWLSGHTRIYIGEDVNIFGCIGISSGRVFDEPKLIIGDRVDIGGGCHFVVNKEIVIENDVNIAGHARFMDSDSHPRDTTDRIADRPPPPEEIKPVRICRYAWIGQNAFIMKGVTIGEGAIIGSNSVVVTDVPPYSVAMGNPARVIAKNLTPVEQPPQA